MKTIRPNQSSITFIRHGQRRSQMEVILSNFDPAISSRDVVKFKSAVSEKGYKYNPRAIKCYLKRLAPVNLWNAVAYIPKIYKIALDFNGRHVRECPVCGNIGFFSAAGLPLRFDAVCKKCGSAERHRQHHLVLDGNPHWVHDADVLHFGAESCFVKSYKLIARSYIRGDLHPTKDEVKVDIQSMHFASDFFDTVICHQVLEHVQDDAAAIRELFRVIRPGGRAMLSVPIVDSWPETFTGRWGPLNNQERDLYFGQDDHVRYYGADFPDRLRQFGFDVVEHIAHEPEVSRYGLVRGSKIFEASKPSLKAK